jgi:hypothetical protein
LLDFGVWVGYGGSITDKENLQMSDSFDPDVPLMDVRFEARPAYGLQGSVEIEVRQLFLTYPEAAMYLFSCAYIAGASRAPTQDIPTLIESGVVAQEVLTFAEEFGLCPTTPTGSV